MIYNLNGIISENSPKDGFWFRESQNEVFFNENEKVYEVEYSCVALHDLIIDKIFGNKQVYYKLLPYISSWVSFGGLDSEIKISKKEFESLVTIEGKSEIVNKLLYFYDCRNLISTIQNSAIETNFLLCEFYRLLNTNTFILPSGPLHIEGLQFASGIIVANIFSIINLLFINLYSQLDFTTKLAYEFQNIATDFSNYPNLRSSKILFGDKKRLTIDNLAGSLFEPSNTIKKIMTIRNEIVHNSSIDNMPKVYQEIKDNHIIEKYILLPDFKDGIIQSYRNRKRFYDTEIKLNEVLPTIVVEFWKRLKLTLDNIK